MTGETTRDRVLRVAMELFGERGYAATTISTIESAAGLSPGSGSLYRHFSSKQELLEVGVRQQLQAAAELRSLLGHDRELAALPVEERLRTVLRLAVARLEHARDLVRMMLREYRAFPELMERLRESQMTGVGEALAQWLPDQPELAGERDWAGVSAVLVAAVSHYWLLRDTFGSDPFDLAEDRYLDAVINLALGALASANAQDPKRT